MQHREAEIENATEMLKSMEAKRKIPEVKNVQKQQYLKK